MIEEFDIKKSYLNPMHDQKVYNIEICDGHVIFHYKLIQFYITDTSQNNNYYDTHHIYKFCDVIFYGCENISAEIRTRNKSNIIGKTYYDEEFLDFINKNNYKIETINYYWSYETVIVYGKLINKDSHYGDDCIITISASKVAYNWKN